MRSALLLCCLAITLLTFSWAQDGPVTIGGVTYDYVDPGPEFTQAPLAEQSWDAPKPSGPESAAGLLPYVTPDPGDYKPDRIPKPEEHVAKLSAALTPGEDEVVWVGVRALDAISALSVSVQTGPAPVTVDVRHEHFWPQRTGWRSRQWYTTPELLLPCADGKRTVPTTNGLLEERDFSLAPGETAAFWLTLTAPADAKPGTYRATVTIGGEGRPALKLPLQVEVLPFELQKPSDRYWLLYADVARWRTMSDEQVLAELRDFARHGITGLVEMPLGSPDLSELSSGKVTFDASAFKRMADLCDEAGIPGPHVCSFGGMPYQVREALKIDCDLNQGTWPEAISAGVEAVARAAVAATADAPNKWYFYGVDEPSGDNTYAIQEYQAWRRGGAETYATFYNIGFLDKASEFLTAPCFVTGLISAENRALDAREACERTGAEFWWYGTGSYVNPFPQEGYMFHNRYGAGYMFWKTGAKASVAWTFCRPHEDVFNDFDGSQANGAEPKEQVTAYPHFLKPNDWTTYQGAIPTIAWESLREGADDYAYLYTLQLLIDEAAQSDKPRAREEAQRASDSLATLLDNIPWANPMGGVAFETSRMDQTRRAVIELILDLRAAIEGRPRSTSTRSQTPFTLNIATVAPEGAGAEALPVIPVVTSATAPKVDGRLDDPCWGNAAVADQFRYSGSGRLAGIPTEARVLCDDRALYVAFDCPEPAMDKLVAKQEGHDTQLVWVDDGIEFFVAGEDRSHYAHVIVNTNGSVYDELEQDPSWDPKIEVGVDKRADGWSVELALPWDDLAAAGIERTQTMALNFCRNRFTQAEESPHSAWSCPYGGFHNPQRFGIALLNEGDVALTDLQLPVLWGAQCVRIGLRNTTDAPLIAEVSTGRRDRHRVRLAANSSASVCAPIKLFKQGNRTVHLTWGVEGQEPQRVDVDTFVPRPITAAGLNGFVSPGDTVNVPLTLTVSPKTAERYRIVAQVTSDGETQTFTMPARAGSNQSIDMRMSDRAQVSICLVNAAGEPVGNKFEGSLLVTP